MNTIRKRAIQIAKAFQAVRKRVPRLNALLDFMAAYLGYLVKLSDIVRSVASFSSMNSVPEHFGAEARRRIHTFASATDVFANETMKVLNDRYSRVRRPRRASTALLTAHRSLIAGLQASTAKLAAAAAPEGTGTDVHIRQAYAAFKDEVNRLSDPMTATEALLGEIRKFGMSSRLKKVSVSMTGDASKLTFDERSTFAAQARRVISLLILNAAKFHWRNRKFEFEFQQLPADGVKQGLLIIKSRSNKLGRFKHNREFKALVQSMNGEFDLPGRIRRTWRRLFPSKRPTAMHRIVIPIPVVEPPKTNGSQGNGSRRNSPPPPAAGAASGGSHAGKVTGLEETQMAMDLPGGGEAESAMVMMHTTPFVSSLTSFLGIRPVAPQMMLPLGGLVLRGV